MPADYWIHPGGASRHGFDSGLPGARTARFHFVSHDDRENAREAFGGGAQKEEDREPRVTQDPKRRRDLHEKRRTHDQGCQDEAGLRIVETPEIRRTRARTLFG
jgi:hypothetical protein